MKQIVNIAISVLNLFSFVATVFLLWFFSDINTNYKLLPIIIGILFFVTLIIFVAANKKNRNKIIYAGVSSISLALLIIETIMFGNDKIYIANLMPSTSLHIIPSFDILRLQRFISDMTKIALIGIPFSVIYIILLKTKCLLCRKAQDAFIVVFIINAPLIIVGVKLFLQYAYAS